MSNWENVLQDEESHDGNLMVDYVFMQDRMLNDDDHIDKENMRSCVSGYGNGFPSSLMPR